MPLRSMAQSPLGRLVELDNPDLANKIGRYDIYTAVCEICDHYGVEKPAWTGIIVDDHDRIFHEVQQKLRRHEQ